MARNGRDAVTRDDKLRTGKPYWLDTPRTSVRVVAWPKDDRYDVIIVGSGISGALAAEAITRSDKTVLVVDRREPVRGSTPASTAMIQHEIDVPLTKLRTQRGHKTSDAAWRRSVQAVRDLVALATRLEISCSMQAKPALLLAGDEMDGRDLEQEAVARRKIGIAAEWIDGERLRRDYGIDRDAAILSQDSATANPAQLAAGLLRVAQTRGAALASPVEITDFAELPSGVALATSCGRVLVADHVVFCTGYEFLKQMQSPSHRVTSTWAIATERMTGLPDWLKRTIVWEAADPYLYFRADPSGRIIAGGEDEDASEKNTSAAILERKAKTIAAKLETVTGLNFGKPEYRWAAPFSVTKDGLPIIDRVDGCERVYAVMGFGGNGITFSVIASQIVATMIDGQSDPDGAMFKLR